MSEEWRPVLGWEGLYEVSDHGRVASCNRDNGRRRTVLKQRAGHGGYLSVSLSSVGRKRMTRNVHLLVLEAYVGRRPSGLVGCHGPAGITVNAASNLRWDTPSNNIRDQLINGTHRSGATLEACGRGHEYTPENTNWTRQCRTCNSSYKKLGNAVAGALTQK